MRRCPIFLAIALLLSSLSGQTENPVLRDDSQSTSGTAEARFDLTNVDLSVDPCVDFYQYACGHWPATHPMPSDRARWSNFTLLAEHNSEILRTLIESTSVASSGRSAIEQKLGDYYASCMDQATINEKGFLPIQPDLDRIAAIQDKATLIRVVAENRTRYGGNVLFMFGAVRDFHDPSINIAFLDQGGLTVPDRDFYLDSGAIGQQFYLDAVKQEFTLIGEAPERAARDADAVFRIEKELAAASMDRISRRDLKNRDHKMSVAELERLAPNLHFEIYFKAAGAPSFTELNVVNPLFFKSIDALLQTTPLEDWKAYLAFHLVRFASPFLSEELERTNFKATQVFTGQRELPPRWKKCTDETSVALRDALGELFTRRNLSSTDKATLLKMVSNLEHALRREINQASWMTEDTKREALAKLAVVRKEVGGPVRWRNYNGLQIVRGDFLGNSFRALDFEAQRLLQTIGKPVATDEWSVPAFAVDPVNSGAQIVFPAGLLQRPFFDRSGDAAVNYGSIGALIGHELIHIFDNQGRNVDSHGRLRGWWTASDAREFDKRARCIADQYSDFVVIDRLKLNGKLTLDENIADNGGARAALQALQDVLAKTANPLARGAAGDASVQRFFLAFAQTWCEDTTQQSLRARLQASSHSVPRWRVNGVLQNMSEFQNAFHCKQGQPMVRPSACTLW